MSEPAVTLTGDETKRILDTLESIERALYGETRAGYVGLVERVGAEETRRKAEDEAEAARRAASDDAIRAEISEFQDRFERLEKRFDRMIWIAIGVGLGSGVGGAWLANAIATGGAPLP